MEKVLRHGKGIAGTLLFIGSCVQILLGIGWLILNFTKFQEFGDSYLYMEISTTFLCDEYTGILYPILIWLARGMANILPLPFYSLLYLLQLCMSCYCAARLIKALGGGNRYIWYGALFLMTIPIALQSHMAVLPNSLTSSLFMLQAAFLLEEKTTITKQSCMVLLWVSCSLLMPEYRYLAGIPVLIAVVIQIRRWKVWKPLILLALGAILVFSSVALTQTRGSHGKILRSLSAVAVSRFVWPYFHAEYYYWPEEIKSFLDEDKAWNISNFADQVSTVFGPLIEKNMGEEQARLIYRQMVRAVIERRTKSIGWAIALDAVSYAASPLVLPAQLEAEGRWLTYGGNYSARNYEIMKEATPVFTKVYLDYGCRWFVLGIVAAFLSELSGAVMMRKYGERNRSGRKSFPQVGLLIGLASILILYYTLHGAGIMDYKNTLFVTCLWYVWMVRKMEAQ